MSGRGSGRKIKFYPFTNPRKCATLSYIVKSSDEESTVPERATEKSRGRRCAAAARGPLLRGMRQRTVSYRQRASTVREYGF